MKCVAEYNKRYANSIKIRLVDALGGKCVVCGYDKCRQALDFHHLDPKAKEYNVNTIRSFEKALKEAKKCVLLCANCHREFHAGLVELPT